MYRHPLHQFFFAEFCTYCQYETRMKKVGQLQDRRYLAMDSALDDLTKKLGATAIPLNGVEFAGKGLKLNNAEDGDYQGEEDYQGEGENDDDYEDEEDDDEDGESDDYSGDDYYNEVHTTPMRRNLDAHQPPSPQIFQRADSPVTQLEDDLHKIMVASGAADSGAAVDLYRKLFGSADESTLGQINNLLPAYLGLLKVIDVIHLFFLQN
ncbi:unnamed protein product [Nesidiocoris tenuis]|uniref:Uncharacterized protein n=1 Tax=Nesidiocoris tenuis TaxID=355587 RepID=A0A6H5G6E9_9HEMI|nr:unnamed protein product [Nesidiocoris tenuis]